MQAVIFDMDGVIFDSEAKGIECWKEVARRYGIQNIENTCYRCLGVNEKAVVQSLILNFILKKKERFF